jgi:integrase
MMAGRIKTATRGAAVGKRFSALKTKLGFRKRVFCFHSLRHTATRAMKEQKIVTDPFLLSIVKNIIGHKDTDITSGRYAGVSGLATKLAVLETIAY